MLVESRQISIISGSLFIAPDSLLVAVLGKGDRGRGEVEDPLESTRCFLSPSFPYTKVFLYFRQPKTDHLFCIVFPYLCHCCNRLTDQFSLSAVVCQPTVTKCHPRPHGILGWRQCDTRKVGPSTASNIEYGQARDEWLPSRCD